MTALEFLDLMPHRIQVRGTIARDNFGYPVPDQPVKTYSCLLDDSTVTQYTQAGPVETIAHTAYVMPYPLDINTGQYDVSPTLITDDSILITPDTKEHFIVSVQTHYDETGQAHNQTVRYE